MKRILFFLFLVVVASSCGKKTRFTVKGVIKGDHKAYISLKRLDVDTPILLDSARIKNNGQFRFSIKSDGPDFYQLGYSSQDFITLIAKPGDRISVGFEGNSLSGEYTIAGSEESEQIRLLDRDLSNTKRKLDSLSTVYSAMQSKAGFDTVKTVLEDQFNSLLREQRRKNIVFIINHIKSLASIKALYQKINPETYVLYDPKDLQYLKIVTDSLTRYYPESKHVQALARDFTKEMNQLYSSQLQELARNLPETKLDPNLMTTAGKRVSLSSLRGKYVLLSFWSVRSKDCIDENLQLKDIYKLYSRKGFEIYQINIDENEQEWKNAVKFDELPWINAREDDPSNLLNARLFNVKAVPANYLFDREGKIIGSELHGKALRIKMEQLFNNNNR